MIHCPHLTPDNQCDVARAMASCNVKTSPSACNACQNETNPRAINVVTIGMALVNKKRRKQDVSELQSLLRSYMPDQEDRPATIKIADYRPGPGNELKKMLAWFAKPSETCNCETRVSVERDIEASIASLQNRSEKHRGQWFAASDEECERVQRSLREHRDTFIQSQPDVPVFRIEFAELVTYPEEVIRNLIDFLGITPSDEEIASAIDHVNPDLRKFG